MLKQFVRWDVLLLLALGAAIFVLEILGIVNPRFATITALIRASIPRWARWMILGWLMFHFGVEG